MKRQDEVFDALSERLDANPYYQMNDQMRLGVRLYYQLCHRLRRQLDYRLGCRLGEVKQ